MFEMGPGSEDQNGPGEHQRDREVSIAYFLLSAKYITLEHPFITHQFSFSLYVHGFWKYVLLHTI